MCKEYVCPSCKGNLSWRSDIIKCLVCRKRFQIINDIPIFINKELEPLNYSHQVDYFENEVKNQHIIDFAAWQKSFIKKISANFFSKEIENKTNLLSIGCGSGYDILHSATRGATCYGCDISFKSLQNIKQKCEFNQINNINLCVASAEHLPFKDASMDFVTSIAVIEHVPDENQYVNEMLRVIKPKGKAFITAPIMYKYIYPLFWPLNLIHDKKIGHLRRYSLNKFQKLFGNRAKIINEYYTGHLAKSILFLINVLLKSKAMEEMAERIDNRHTKKKYGANNISVVLERGGYL